MNNNICKIIVIDIDLFDGTAGPDCILDKFGIRPAIVRPGRAAPAPGRVLGGTI